MVQKINKKKNPFFFGWFPCATTLMVHSVLLVLAKFLTVVAVMLFLVLYYSSPYTNDRVKRLFFYQGFQFTLPPSVRFHPCPPLAVQPRVSKELLEMSECISGLFESRNIQYWATGHTLLGQHFVQGPLPWRDKLEFAVRYDAAQHRELLKLRNVLETMGYVLVKFSGGYRLSKKNVLYFPYINIFLVSSWNRDVAVCTPLSELNECTFADTHRLVGSVSDSSSVFPLKLGVFANHTISIPNQPQKVLQKMFSFMQDGSVVLETSAYQENVHMFSNSLVNRSFTL